MKPVNATLRRYDLPPLSDPSVDFVGIARAVEENWTTHESADFFGLVRPNWKDPLKELRLVESLMRSRGWLDKNGTRRFLNDYRTAR